MDRLITTTIVALGVALCMPSCAGDGVAGDDDVASADDADGDGFSEAEGDCDDSNPDVNFMAQEVCDGVDNDCDLQVDESFDADFDGATVCGADGVINTGDEDCDDSDDALNLLDVDEDGFTTCAGDCDDASPTIHPGAQETCNGLDDNCDGVLPPDDVDTDADGWLACDGDCNDGEWTVHPGAPEQCNGVDDDCEPATDENTDMDGDGFSVCDGDCDDTNPSLSSEDADGDGSSTCDGDCDDTDVLLGPQALELCDVVDNDCDGIVDEGCVTCTIRVPDDQLSLSAALASVSDGDVICVDPGTYFEQIDFHGTNVHLAAVAGPVVTIIDGGDQGSTVTFESWEGPGAVLEGFTITGGHADLSGGGVTASFADPTLTRLVITDNEAGWIGGGMLLFNSSPTLEDVRFVNNVMTEQPGRPVPMNDLLHGETGGGGLLACQSGATLSRVTFEGNRALNISRGGGLMAIQSSLVLEDVRFEGNEANFGAGAVFKDCAEVLIEGASFTGNLGGDLVDSGAGAGLAVEGTVLRASHVLFAANRSGNNGAGLDLRDESLVELTHAVIVGNQAGYDGGGLSIYDADVVLESCVVARNRADHHGGGLDVQWPERLELVNTVIVGNTAGVHGGGLALDNYQNAEFTHCDVWGNAPTDIDTQSNPSGANGNLEHGYPVASATMVAREVHGPVTTRRTMKPKIPSPYLRLLNR